MSKFFSFNIFLSLFAMSMFTSFFVSSSFAQSSSGNFSFNLLRSDESISLKDFKGQSILIVNTASKCGFTKQYKGLEELYQKYKSRGFQVIGVPSGNFASQEFDTSEEIEKFCRINYGVSFLITEKYDVIGKNAHPFYKWAKEELGFGTGPKWNFHKYLLNQNGELVDYFHSTTKPNSDKIIQAIEVLLSNSSEQIIDEQM